MEARRVDPELVGRIRDIVHEHDEFGFLWFHQVTSSESLPVHCQEWVAYYFWALRRRINMAVDAFRGSLKTTIFSGYLTGYLIGCFPWLENLIVQAADNMAAENTSFLSSLISDNPGWRIVFPHVVPDERKWGAEGYEVQDSSMPYGFWRRKRSKMATLVGGGYKSAVVLGKHPRGHFIRDDVNNYKNTRSMRELKAVKDIVFKEMEPAAESCMMQIDVFTPWVQGDVGDTVKKRKSVLHVRTPILKLDAEGNLTDEPAWPEKFPKEKIEELRENLPPAEFGQMYLCTLKAMEGQNLPGAWLQPKYPHEEIDPEWPTYIGVDYMSLSDETAVRGRDWFTLAVNRLHPNGFLIMETGYRGQITRAQAEDICLNWGSQYQDTLRVMRIEKLGKAEEFANWMMTNAPFRVRAEGVKNRSKAERFEVEMAPVFRSGKVRISDADDPFLAQFEREWLAWDGLETFPDDTLDAQWHAIAAAKGFIKPRRDELEAQTETYANPYQAFAAR